MIDNQLISISLFSGAFGLDLGMEQSGFHTVSVVEIDPDCTKTIVLNRSYLTESAVPRDIRSVEASTLLEEGGRVLKLERALFPGEVDLVTGGPPCQPFSTAGKRQSIGDPRGSLFMDFLRIVKEIQPRFFVMENVRGLLSASIRHRPIDKRGDKHPPLEPDEQPGSALTVVIKETELLGYKVVYKLLQTADYGVPQTRERAIFIGSLGGKHIEFPLPTHSNYGKSGMHKWLSLRETFILVDQEPEYIPYSAKRLKYLSLLKEGQNWRSLPENLKREAMGGAYNSGGGKVGFYRRLAWDKPSPTVTTSPHQKATDMCHPEELRPLSVRECAKIQTFPDDWLFYGSVTSKYRQIGNAVPVKFARAIGEHIKNLIYDEAPKRREDIFQLTLFELSEFTSFNLPNSTVFLQGTEKVSEQFHEMLAYALEKEVRLPAKKARSLASYFADIEDFLKIEEQNLKNIKGISGQTILKLNDDEISRIIKFNSSGYLSKHLSVAENYLAIISRVFTKTQLTMIQSLSLENLNPNPFLMQALNLDRPEEVIRLNVYMATTRSIVTSMGFFLEKLLLTCSENIEKPNKKESGGWDLIKNTAEGERTWLQIKSGPNSMDKDQIVYWSAKIQEKISEGEQAYLGFTYGKKSNNTVTIGLLRQLLPDWEIKTLIGRELWDFLSEDPDYSSQLFKILRKSAKQILNNNSISDEIEKHSQKITENFIKKYGDGMQGISSYIKEIF
jgi:DNA (cytosine-5)-methyltransferase 1